MPFTSTYYSYFKRCQRAVFPPPPLPHAPPSAPLPVDPSSESRLPDPSHTIRLPAPAPGATTHPHTTSRSPEPPCVKTPASPRPASRPEPCPMGRAASAVRPSSLRKLRCGSRTADHPTRRPRGAGKRQSGKESQPQAPDTPCPHSALRAIRPPSAGTPRPPRPLIRYLT